jgi:hypothetical protein
MDYETQERARGGCLVVAILVVIGGFLLLGSIPKGKDEAARRGGDNDTGQFLSGNELLSRNQLNLLSEVTNEFYDCVGYASCVVTTDNSVENTTNDTRTNTTVEGDRNVVIGSDGTKLCQDPATGIYSACQQGQ